MPDAVARAELLDQTWKTVLRQSIEAERSGDLEAAFALLLAQSTVLATHRDANAHLARLALKTGRSAEAEAALQRVLALDPEHTTALLQLVQLNERAKRNAEAVPLLHRLIRQKPGDIILLYRLGNAAFRAGDFAQAATALAPVVRSEAPPPAALPTLALAFERLQQPHDVVALLAPRLEGGGLDPALLLLLGRARLATGAATEAVPPLSMALALLPGTAEAVLLLAQAMAQSGDLDSAVELLGEAAAADPANIRFPLSLGRLTEARRDGIAREAFLNVLRIAPDNAMAIQRLQLIGARLLLAAADAAACVFGDLGPETLAERGNAHHLLGNRAEAERHFRQACAVDPSNTSHQEKLAQVLHETGQYAAAAAVYREAGLASRHNLPASLEAGLLDIAVAAGGDAAQVRKRLARGLLPNRAGWSPGQRHAWGRDTTRLITRWLFNGTGNLDSVMQFAEPADWRKLGEESKGAGALLAGTHLGLTHLSVFMLAASGLPYRFVAKSSELVMAFPEQAIDAVARDSHISLARLGSTLKSGGVVFIAADGQAGRRGHAFAYRGFHARLAAGPAALAAVAGAPAYFYQSYFADDRIKTAILRGPPTDPASSREAWTRRWFAFYEAQYCRMLDLGPDNLSDPAFRALHGGP